MSQNPAQPDINQLLKESKQCDLVMKGGITSGIIYPPLVIKLHKDGYAFRSVGGTSAGAIAAAVTAAAEYGKVSRAPGTKESSADSFHKLEEIGKWLGRGRNLRNLFSPSSDTKALMNTLFGYSQFNWLRWPPLQFFASVIFNDTLAFVGGAVLGVALSFLLAILIAGRVDGVTHGWGLVVPVVFALLGGLLVVVWHLYQIIKNTLPNTNFGFGLCTGRGTDLKKLDKKVLTDWLSASINNLAGMGKGANDEPLTFGDLWHPPGWKGKDEKEKRIDLRMMTSNLSQNQPYVLPFEQDLFIFNEHELLKYFPPGVVKHMVKHTRPYEGVRLPEGFYFLPEAKNLPVIFATRLSLSFPILISMIPLYTLSAKSFSDEVCGKIVDAADESKSVTAKTKEQKIIFTEETGRGQLAKKVEAHTVPELKHEDLQLNWFSDGGICSNFPIHFFDAWLPTRPTFGVNLTSQLAKGKPQAGDIAERIKERSSVAPVRAEYEVTADTRSAEEVYDKDVYLPKPNDILPPEWIPINGIGKFLEAIFTTAQNYRDNMQSMLPSYRERIVQIRLTDDEGGLNLNMSPEIIAEVVRKGEDAGNALVEEFNLNTHQWVRFRVFMKQMEKSLNKMNKVMNDCPFYMNTLNPPLPSQFPYQRDDEWLRNAKRQLEEMRDLINKLTPPELFQPEPPLPEPVLRVTPEI